MYGWIVDGISSLFESVKGQNPSEWPGKGNVSADIPTLSGARAPRRGSDGRPAKRNYQSVDVADNVCQSDPIEVKRRRRDVVISFVKKTLAGAAGLLRRHKPLAKSYEDGQYEDAQPVPMGIDELHTSWLENTEWRTDKPVAGGMNPFQSSSTPLLRKCSGPALSAGLPDRGRDKDRRGSLQLLTSRPNLRVGTHSPDQTCNGIGHSRWYKTNLTVEEAIKQNHKEHYRRLLEMVSEKYSKNQPLPFTQTKPQDVSLSRREHSAASGKGFESLPKKTGYTAAPSVFTWRNASATKDRWGSFTHSKTFHGASEEEQHARHVKQPAAELDLSAEIATRLSLVDRETPAVSRTHATHTPHARHIDEDIPGLTKEMAAEVTSALAQNDPNLVLSAAFKLRVTQRDLATLQEGGWLNDEVMNFYLSLVMEQCSDQAAGLKVYSFSTFFFPKLLGGGGGGGQTGGHAAVKRWTKAVDLFVYDLVLVPLHLDIHWAMAVIDLNSKTVKSYDSMGQRHDDVCALLLRYLKDEHKAKKGRELDGVKWTVGSMRATEIPQQKNGSDCGVFACKYAEYIAKGKPLTFKQCHMPLFRKLMIWEILNRKLL